MVLARERRTFSLDLAEVLMVSVCCLNVMPLSKVTPNSLKVSLHGIEEWFSVMLGLTLYSLWHGVIRVSEDLLVEIFILLRLNQSSNVSM